MDRCMYVCMYVWIDGQMYIYICMYGWIERWMDVWTYRWMDGWLDGWMGRQAYVCMYV